MVITAVPEYGRVGLWTSDGTQSGTLPVVDLPKGSRAALHTVSRSCRFPPALYGRPLQEEDDKETPEIWRTDETPQGTQIVATLPLWSFFHQWTPWNGKLLFAAIGHSSRAAMAFTDGSSGRAMGPSREPTMELSRGR